MRTSDRFKLFSEWKFLSKKYSPNIYVVIRKKVYRHAYTQQHNLHNTYTVTQPHKLYNGNKQQKLNKSVMKFWFSHSYFIDN